MTRRILSLLVGISLLALATLTRPASTFAQAVYGSIVGTVTDAQGAAVPGAKITVTSVGQGVSFNSTANESGNYEQGQLIPGEYNVKVESPGFQAYVQQSVQINADTSTQVNASLQLGQVTQTVTVTSAVPLLQTEKTDVGAIYSTRSVKELPILNRNFSEFELMTPGAVQLQWQHAASENPQGTIQILVNGQEFGGTDYQLDGTDNHDVILGIQVVNPNLDSISEVKVTTADQSAEFPEADAGVVTAQTKSGTNEIHGSAFGFRRTDATEARDPFANSVINPLTGKFLPRTLWDQFGGSLGGPIKKDKTFIFGDYQGSRQRNGGSISTRVPTATERAGDLSGLGVNIFDPYGSNGAIVAPADRTQFAGNVIPPALLSSQAQKLLALIPLPNVPGVIGALNNYDGSGVQIFDTDSFDVRADQYQTEKLHLFGRYTFQRYYQQAPGAFGNEAGGPNLNGIRFAGISNARTQSLAQGFDYTVTPSVITDFRFGFFRYRVFVSPNGLGTTPAADAGIPGLNTSAITSGTPYFNINGSDGFSFGYALGVNGCNCPLNEQEEQFQFVNNWTAIHGNHTFKFGADVRRALNLRVPSDAHRAGEVTFGNNNIYLTAGAGGGGLGLADFLLGEPNRFNRYVSNTTDAAERQTRMFYYGQDTWRVTQKLTFNYGLRWEILFPQTVSGPGRGGWVNVFTGEDVVAGTPGAGLNGGIRNSFTNFGPVTGLAYQVNPKTIVRMGYGRDFDVGLFGSVFGHTVTQNIPVLAQQSISPSVPFSDVFNLATGPPALDPGTILATQPKGASGLPLYPGQLASPHVLPLKVRVPTVDSWNVTVQRELGNNMSFQVGWVGAKGTHVFAGDGPNYNINQASIQGYSTQTGPECNNTFPCTNAREPFFQKYGWTQGVQWYGNDVSDNYNSLQAVFKRRFAAGYSLTVNYTWSKCFDFGGGYSGAPEAGAVAYGPCDFNRSQVLNVQHLVEFPFGHGKRFLNSSSKALDYVVGGWQLNGIWNLQSGQPFTPSYQNCGSDQDVGTCRPDKVGDAVLSNRTQNKWFATTGGVLLSANGQTIGPWRRPQAGTLGTTAWDSLYGPHFYETDMSLFKNFTITERVRGQIRVEGYNIFNVANLGQPQGQVDASNAGVIQSTFYPGNTEGMRNFQFGLRFDF